MSAQTASGVMCACSQTSYRGTFCLSNHETLKTQQSNTRERERAIERQHRQAPLLNNAPQDTKPNNARGRVKGRRGGGVPRGIQDTADDKRAFARIAFTVSSYHTVRLPTIASRGTQNKRIAYFCVVSIYRITGLAEHNTSKTESNTHKTISETRETRELTSPLRTHRATTRCHLRYRQQQQLYIVPETHAFLKYQNPNDSYTPDS